MQSLNVNMLTLEQLEQFTHKLPNYTHRQIDYIYHLLGYYLCLNTCWKTLEVLKTKKYYYY